MNATIKFFNNVARTWDETTRHNDSNTLNHILQCANIHRGDNVLDAGTGTGILLPHLSKAIGPFGGIDALDLSSEMLAVAHERNAGLSLPVRFLLSDIENDPVQTLYDRILLINVLPHLERPMETLMRLYFTNLAGAGSVTVAQTGSRDEANEENAALDGIHTHILPPAAEFAARLSDAGILVDYVEDTPVCWLLRLRRR